MSTLNLPVELTPCAQSSTSESEMLNQNSSSATRSSTGIVDDAAVLVAEDHITGLHCRQQAVHITGDEIVDELRGVGTLDLDLAFDGPHPTC